MATMTRVLLAVVVGGCVLAGCTTGSGHSRSASNSIGAVVAPLTPSIPGLFRTGVQHCGDPYAVTATTVDGTIPLADCPGLVGLRPTPVTTVHVGGEVTIAGLPAHAFLTTEPGDLLQGQGTTFVAVHEGTVVINVYGASCVQDSSGVQGETCPLLKLQVSRPAS